MPLQLPPSTGASPTPTQLATSGASSLTGRELLHRGVRLWRRGSSGSPGLGTQLTQMPGAAGPGRSTAYVGVTPHAMLPDAASGAGWPVSGKQRRPLPVPAVTVPAPVSAWQQQPDHLVAANHGAATEAGWSVSGKQQGRLLPVSAATAQAPVSALQRQPGQLVANPPQEGQQEAQRASGSKWPPHIRPGQRYVAAPTPRAPPPSLAVEPPPAVDAASAGTGVAETTGDYVEGVVQRIVYRSEATGYTVFRVKPTSSSCVADSLPSTSSHLPSGALTPVTVTGTFTQLSAGQRVRFEGAWERHKRHGLQLAAVRCEELAMTGREGLVSYLSGGAIPGVGSVTARRLVECFDDAVLDVLNAPDAVHQLRRCKGVGVKLAQKIKEGWDRSRGTREGEMFLQRHGVPPRVAQQVVKRYGERTEAVVREDPYEALLPIKAARFRTAEALACAVGAGPDIPSRAGFAMLHCLSTAAAREGHTYLPWRLLREQTLQLLRRTGRPLRDESLLVETAAAMAGDCYMVAEAEAAAPPSAARSWAEAAALARHDRGALRALLLSLRAPGERAAGGTHGGGGRPVLSPEAVDSVLFHFDVGLLDVLAQGQATAAAALMGCQGIGVKRAHEVKEAWDAAVGAGAPPVPAGGWMDAPGTRCYAPSLHAAEASVSDVLGRLAREAAAQRGERAAGCGSLLELEARVARWVANFERRFGQLSEGQRHAIRVAATSPVVVITGGPGCGKTHVTRAIVKLWAKMPGGCKGRKRVRLAAPTGRAAQRLSEATGAPAMTLHRLLGYVPQHQRGSGGEEEGEGLEQDSVFTFNRSNPLQGDCFLVDEASMLDLPLAASLVQALPAGAQLVLVGDADQLPPVGPGSVLAHVIASGTVPVVDLRQIFRQAASSAIITSAHAINAGRLPTLTPCPPSLDALDAAATAAPRGGEAAGEAACSRSQRDALWVRLPDGADGGAVQGTLLAVVTALQRRLGIDIRSNVQVLSPMRKGGSGTWVLNGALQALLNPPAEGKPELRLNLEAAGGAALRLGDRVVQVRNDHEAEVYNGDVGFVAEVSPAERQLVVEFPSAPPPAVLPAAPEDRAAASASAGSLQEDGGEEGSGGGAGKPRRVRYSGAQALERIEAAWATTVHKAQGGEAEVVVLVLVDAHTKLLTRQLLYTAVTRAKRLLVVVGTHGAIASAVSAKAGDTRLSSLQQRLQQAADCTRVEPCVFNGMATAAGVPEPQRSAQRYDQSDEEAATSS